jgi:hypothetical protein
MGGHLQGCSDNTIIADEDEAVFTVMIMMIIIIYLFELQMGFYPMAVVYAGTMQITIISEISNIFASSFFENL